MEKKLTKSFDKKISGVCGGIAEYLGIDVLKGEPKNVVKFKMSQTNMNILDDINSKYPVAIGLAMRDFIE